MKIVKRNLDHARSRIVNRSPGVRVRKRVKRRIQIILTKSRHIRRINQTKKKENQLDAELMRSNECDGVLHFAM